MLPESVFTSGDPLEFESFITRRSGVTMDWIPASAKARREQSRKKRAARAVKAEEMQKQRAEEIAQQKAEMKEAFLKAREARKAKRELEQSEQRDTEREVTEREE